MATEQHDADQAAPPTIRELVPELDTQISRRERDLAAKYVAKVHAAPARYQPMTRQASPSTLRYVQLAFSLSWYAWARRYVLPFVVVGSLVLAAGILVTSPWLMVAGVLLWLPAVPGLVHLTRRASLYNNYFRARLGPPI